MDLNFKVIRGQVLSFLTSEPTIPLKITSIPPLEEACEESARFWEIEIALRD